MKALIISEDSTKDRYVVKPIVEKLLGMHGKESAHVEVLEKPKPRGIAQALDISILKMIIANHPMVSLFLLLVDRDGYEYRVEELREREKQLRPNLGVNRCLIAECAYQEVEVWALATVDVDRVWALAELRGELKPKDTFYYPYVVRRGIAGRLGDGRQILGQEAARNIKTLLARCPEVRNLEKRIADFIRNAEPSGEPYRGL
ncbi:MAG: hypothetical protein FWD57_14425 [Polyangiaceae bacterium]|nr:hypothetical protein [Polyangiaceae bacterium]